MGLQSFPCLSRQKLHNFGDPSFLLRNEDQLQEMKQNWVPLLTWWRSLAIGRPCASQR